MKKTGRNLLLLTLFMLLMAIGVTAEAKSNVKSVKLLTTYKNNKEYCKVQGLDASGKAVWTYKCSTTEAAQCCHVSCTSNGAYTYVVDGSTWIRVNTQTGKVLKKKKNLFPYQLCSVAQYIDGSGNLYIIGYLDSVLFKVNKNGKILWKTDLGDKAVWPNRIEKDGKKIKVGFEAEWGYSYVWVNAKTGMMTEIVM